MVELKEIEEKLESLAGQFNDLAVLVKEFKEPQFPHLKAEDVPYLDLFKNNGKVLFNGDAHGSEYKVVVYGNGDVTIDGKKYPLNTSVRGHTYMILSFPLTEHNSKYLSSNLDYKALENAKVSIANDPDHTYDLQKFGTVNLFRAGNDISKELERVFYANIK